jgi:hypothetical protein
MQGGATRGIHSIILVNEHAAHACGGSLPTTGLRRLGCQAATTYGQLRVAMILQLQMVLQE